jgi:cytidyltransferase-like protein
MHAHDTLPAFLTKICPRSDLAHRLAGLPRPWVFTNGVFDVLHRGHVVYLAQARDLGGSLIVALNTDASVRRLGKGDDRPLNQEMDRAIVMASQASVSLVTWFDEDTPVQIDCGESTRRPRQRRRLRHGKIAGNRADADLGRNRAGTAICCRLFNHGLASEDSRPISPTPESPAPWARPQTPPPTMPNRRRVQTAPRPAPPGLALR